MLTLHAIKNTIKQRVSCLPVIFYVYLTVTALIETTKCRIIPAFVGVFPRLLTRVCYLVFLDLTLFLVGDTRGGELGTGLWTL